MADKLKYLEREILNKVLNTAETALQVDIVAGAEYAEDSAHTTADTGSFVLGVRNDALAALGGADGDYVPFQMNASGALYVEVSSSSGDGAIYADDADWSDGSSKHVLVGGLYQSSPQSITDGDVGPLQVNANGNLIVDLSATDNAVLDAMVVDLAAIEVLLTAANVDHAANEVLLGTIDADTNAIKVDMAAIEVLLTAANVDHAANEVLLTGIDADTNAIKVDMAAIEVLLTAANVDHAANEVLLTGIDADTDAIKTDMAAIEVLLTAANVDHAANEVLLGTIDSDTNDIKTATESSNTHLGNMFYDTALAVTPSDGSDLTGEPFYAVYVGTGGNLKVDMSDGGAAVTLSNVASGQLLPIMVERIYATGTTASNIIAFK